MKVHELINGCVESTLFEIKDFTNKSIKQYIKTNQLTNVDFQVVDNHFVTILHDDGNVTLIKMNEE